MKRRVSVRPALALTMALMLTWLGAVSAPAASAGGVEPLAGFGAEASTEDYIIWEDAPFYIKLKFDENYEILRRSDTEGWRFIGDDGSVRWDDGKLEAYFAGLKEKYDTPMGEVAFTTHDGEERVFESQLCGWQLNIDFSVSRLKTAVAEGSFEMDPAFNSGLVYSAKNGVGNSYVEVDIDEQKVFLYEDGECTLETGCVTGTLDYTDTRKGVFQVQGKSSPATLRDVDKNGNKYEQPVEYWIAFNGSQGLHDAPWRGDFGGEYYKTWGSHGCVNLPPEAAKQIYRAVYIYFPVIVY